MPLTHRPNPGGPFCVQSCAAGRTGGGDVGVVVAALDAQIVNVALPAIRASLVAACPGRSKLRDHQCPNAEIAASERSPRLHRSSRSPTGIHLDQPAGLTGRCTSSDLLASAPVHMPVCLSNRDHRLLILDNVQNHINRD